MKCLILSRWIVSKWIGHCKQTTKCILISNVRIDFWIDWNGHLTLHLTFELFCVKSEHFAQCDTSAFGNVNFSTIGGWQTVCIKMSKQWFLIFTMEKDLRSKHILWKWLASRHFSLFLFNFFFSNDLHVCAIFHEWMVWKSRIAYWISTSYWQCAQISNAMPKNPEEKQKQQKIEWNNLLSSLNRWISPILNPYLNPCKQKGSKCWCKLHNMAQWESVKVQNNNTTANLCCWLQHWGSNCHLNCTEHISQWTFVSLPFFCNFFRKLNRWIKKISGPVGVIDDSLAK